MKRNVRICVLAVLLAMTVLFTGCKLLQTAQNKVVEFSLETVIDQSIDSVVKDNGEIGRVAEQMQSKVEMKVISSTISGSGMTATCLVTAPDLTEFIGSFDINDYADEQALCDAVIAAINNAPVTEKEVTIGLNKTETGYEPTNIEEFIEAYLGGGMDILEDLQDQSK